MSEQSEPQLISFRSKNESESEGNVFKEANDGSPYSQSPAVELDEEGKEKKGNKFFNAIKDFFNAPNTKITHGKTLNDVPNKKIDKINSKVIYAFEAPENALHSIHKRKLQRKSENSDVPPVSGIVNWKERNDVCYGIVTSLYEREKDSDRNAGDPVADCLAIVARPNSCILALADGVNWGERSMLAARSAVYGAVTYLTANENLDNAQTTKDVFRSILRAFENAQNVIMEEEATLTTLCVGVVISLADKDKWGLCVVNVGDSLAFVYNEEAGVREVTMGSHSLDEVRDMRLSGGALGPADGVNPDLGNLTLSYTQLEDNDIVFLSSDGISDNFDPVIGRFRTFRKYSKQSPNVQRKGAGVEERKRSGSDQSTREYALSQEKDYDLVELSTLTPKERHQGMLLKMRYIVECEDGPTGTKATAIGVCAKFMNFVLNNTNERRRFLEDEGMSDAEMHSLSTKDRKERTLYIKSKLSTKPGKLDHASIVAFQVGELVEKPIINVTRSSSEGFVVVDEDVPRCESDRTNKDSSEKVNSIPLANMQQSKMLKNLFEEIAL